MNGSPSAGTSPTDPGPNRLSIAHLLLWTATTAATLAFLQLVDRQAGRGGAVSTDLSAQLQRGIAYAMTPVFGAALAGVALALWRAALGRPGFPRQPGHWLLAIAGTWTLGLGLHIWLLEGGQHNEAAVAILAFPVLPIVAAVAAVAALGEAEPFAWRAILISAAVCLVWLAMNVLTVLPFRDSPAVSLLLFPLIVPVLGLPAVVLAIAATAILDLTSPHCYDILHWAGVGTLLLMALHPALIVMVQVAIHG